MVPVNAADPRFLFIHQDFSGLVTPESPARPGERLHLYITGVDPNDLAIERQSNIAVLQGPANPILVDRPLALSLRVVGLQTTPYSPSLQLLTLEPLPNSPFPATPNQTLILALQLHRKDGGALLTSAFAWLSVTPN